MASTQSDKVERAEEKVAENATVVAKKATLKENAQSYGARVEREA